ncbi:hypothetical protein [Sphingobacterium pedocola]|uniref:Uncharacterized protein n=1 Tax=Sphingobacterium pedocola TaxID=2082722 RepID=A0ABR9TD77_9SPHI|nr:hypothetical protein [Sphingobacterium pedocola]MBE8723246.1 hypothetical protein [Sphingobacterium pedocola]
MKKLMNVIIALALLISSVGCKDKKNGMEPEAPVIDITASGFTFANDAVHLSVLADSTLVFDYAITAKAKIQQLTQVIDSHETTLVEGKGLDKYQGQLKVDIPAEDNTISVKLEVMDAGNRVETKSFSIVVKKRTIVVEETSVSGGTAELSWNAPAGLGDQKLIVLTSNTHTLTPPDKSIWLGFGEGWLYEESEGTAFPTTIVSGSEQWVIEGNNLRFVHIDEQGYRWARSVLKPGGAANPSGAGSINWDTGSIIGPGESTFMYSVSRCLAGINPGATYQWKQDRIRAASNLNGSSSNSAYITETTTGGTGPRMQSYRGDGAKSTSTPTPRHQGLVHRFGWLWKQNTPDLEDGLAKTFLLDDDRPSMVIHIPKNSSNQVQNDVVKSAFPERSRWVLWQDYIGNNDDASKAADIEILRTDMYVQRGGVLLFLADGTTPETTSIAVPLRYVSSDDVTNTITLKMWSQGEISFEASSILLFDADLNFLKGVSLNP